MRKIGWAITVVWLTSGAALAQTARDPRALATYEEGKRLYDRGEYAAALRHFDGAAEIEPGVARWQYNRGLALRKLKRAAEAREALLKSRSLDPEYKRAEIDKRLSELGGLPPATDRPVQVEADSPAPNSPSGEAASPEPSSTGSEPDSGEDFTGYFVLAGILGAIVLFVVLAVKAGRRRAGLVAASAEGGQQRLDALANRLGGVERAFAAGEDPEARAWVEKATRAEQLAGKLLPRAKLKPKKLPELEAALSEAEHSAEEAEQRLEARFGPELTLAKAERAGCYFCARPLPNPESRIQVSVKQGAESFPAAVCSDCAAQAEAGEPPRVTVVDVMGRQVHWSEVPAFDPYLNRHQPYPDASRVSLHQFTPGRSLGEIALLAAGGALALGAGAALIGGAGHLLDLDGLRSTAAAQAAARAAAEGHSGGRWHDQS